MVTFNAAPVYDPNVCLARAVDLTLAGGHAQPDPEDWAVRYAGPELYDPDRSDDNLLHANQERLFQPVRRWLEQSDGHPFQGPADALELRELARTGLRGVGQDLMGLAREHGVVVQSEQPQRVKPLPPEAWHVHMTGDPLSSYGIRYAGPKDAAASEYHIDLNTLHRAAPAQTASAMQQYFLFSTQDVLASQALTGLAAHRFPLSQAIPESYAGLLGAPDEDRIRLQRLQDILGRLCAIPVGNEHGMIQDRLGDLDRTILRGAVLRRTVRLRPSLYLDHRSRCQAESPDHRREVERYRRLHDVVTAPDLTPDTGFSRSAQDFLENPTLLLVPGIGTEAFRHETNLNSNDIALVARTGEPDIDARDSDDVRRVAAATLGLLIAQRHHNMAVAAPGISRLLGDVLIDDARPVPQGRLDRAIAYMEETAPRTA